MNTASHVIEAASPAFARTTDAWTAFWADSDQSSCAAGAPEIGRVLANHWAAFSGSLAHATRILDLGCGACAVGRELIGVRPDLHVTGIDAAQIPPSSHPRIAVLPHTAMEALPFPERFGAVVSQFGYEYSRNEEAARQIERVLAPGAKLSFLVHHAESAIVAATLARLDAIDEFLSPALRAAFCSGDTAAFSALTAALLERHPHDGVVAHLARALPSRLRNPPAKRIAIWAAIEEALAPERYVADSLKACCVAPAQLAEWLGPLRSACELMPVTVLREPNGDPIAWSIEGRGS